VDTSESVGWSWRDVHDKGPQSDAPEFGADPVRFGFDRGGTFADVARSLDLHVNANTSPAESDAFARLARWARGIPDELAFWRSVLPRLKVGSPADHYRLAPDAPVHAHLDEAIAEIGGESVRILDVGAGPLSGVGKTSGRARIELTAVDPLARDYARILADLAIDPPVPTKLADGECLGDFFPEGSFDLVVMENSLDHCWDPLQVVGQMLQVVRIGGIVMLDHFEREAEIEAYQGFHQWNVENVGGRLMLWNASQRHCVDDAFRASCMVRTETIPSAIWGQPRTVVRARLVKTAPLVGFAFDDLRAKYANQLGLISDLATALEAVDHEPATSPAATSSAVTVAARALMRAVAASARRRLRRRPTSRASGSPG
jgi:SAM-dependent methyltransferase